MAGPILTMTSLQQEVFVQVHRVLSKEQSKEDGEDDGEDELLSPWVFPEGTDKAAHLAALVAQQVAAASPTDARSEGSDAPSEGSDATSDGIDSGDRLYLDSVKAESVPSWFTNPAKEAARVRAYVTNGRRALRRARAVGRALARVIRATARAGDKRMRRFRTELDAVKVTDQNAAQYQALAADAEAAAGSIVRLGKQATVVGLGKTDVAQTWDIFRQINDEVNRQTRRQIFNAGVQYVETYGHPKRRHPVVLVPGFGGTRLRARLRSRKSLARCGLGADKLRDVWLSSRRLFGFMTRKGRRNCLYDVLSLRWNGNDFAAPRKYVVRRVKGTRGVGLLDRGVASSLSEYFNPLIKSLETVGYRRGQNLRALSYDWRYRPDQPKMARAYKRWQTLIENLYENNGRLPVVAVAHAMGSQHFVHFLHHVVLKNDALGRAWINKYIHSFVSIGGNHAGAPKVIKALLSGSRLSMPFFSKKKTGTMISTFGSTAFMLPATAAWGSRPLLMIKEADGRTRGYSALRMERLLQRGYSKPAAFHYTKVNRFLSVPPQLVRDAHFLFGHSVPTPLSYVYKRTFTRKGLAKGIRWVATERGSGDGFVPRRSSTFLCKTWSTASCRGYAKVNHRELLWHLPVLTRVLEVATGIREAQKGLVAPNPNPLDHIDVDRTKVTKPTFETAPDLGAPADVDGQEPNLSTSVLPGDDSQDQPVPLFGAK